tara:strand:+ start:98 stop:547 length:450 start_codon:yes stop_codon:yes gene_type:complete
MRQITQHDAPGFDPARMAEDERIVARGFWRKLRSVAGAIPFAKEAAAAYCSAQESETPIGVKAAIITAHAYFIVPTDLIPDIIIGLGYNDDINVFWTAWRVVSRYITDAHRSRPAELLDRPPRDEVHPGAPSRRTVGDWRYRPRRTDNT